MLNLRILSQAQAEENVQPELKSKEHWDEMKSEIYSQHEIAFGDIVKAIQKAISGANEDGMTRKQLRKESGLKKKHFKQVEGVDMDTPIGDVIKVLAATGRTLAVVPLEDVEQKQDGTNG